MSRERAEALARVIACRLYALTEQQLETVDRETTRMVIEAVEGSDAGESNWRPSDGVSA